MILGALAAFALALAQAPDALGQPPDQTESQAPDQSEAPQTDWRQADSPMQTEAQPPETDDRRGAETPDTGTSGDTTPSAAPRSETAAAALEDVVPRASARGGAPPQMNAYFGCLEGQAARLDDHTSDAATIASAIAGDCSDQLETYLARLRGTTQTYVDQATVDAIRKNTSLKAVLIERRNIPRSGN